ncbi:MAG: S-methyl-5-thioribose-1-phosphate isomerase, partial [Candidatus Methanofastidiosa archaeon]|nr:S-methyl-5-thioribose-1-phosphate isomerase [Candidatus Methanofastidiosa archaeon]
MRTIYFDNGKVVMIDQTKLPSKLEMRQCEDVQCLIEAIKTLRVRGAPALGVAGAYAIVLSAQAHINDDDEAFIDGVNRDAMRVAASRPTAVNLGWGVESQMRIISMRPKKEEALRLLVENAERIAEMDIENNRRIGKYGSSLIENGDGILTHCNAGALACVDYGTALGVIRSAHEDGKRIHVYVDETRPLCQGSRLTAWEMENESIPATLITDSMAGFLMARG